MSDLITETMETDNSACDDERDVYEGPHETKNAPENEDDETEDAPLVDDSDSQQEDLEEETNSTGIVEAEPKLENGAGEKPDGLLGYKYKRVLKHDSPRNSTEPLPEGWIVTTHSSGFPIYFHKKTRVITWSRPYSLLSGYILKHKVPLQSIPCLYYMKNKLKLDELNKPSESAMPSESETENMVVESMNKENESGTEGQKSSTNVDPSVAQPKVILHQQKDLALDDEELKGYLEKRFVFEMLKIPQFKKWSQRRDFNRNLKRKKLEETHNASEEVSKTGESQAGPVITLTVEQEDGSGGGTRNRKFVLNTTGKPMICILHEYAQRVLRVQPHYVFGIREDAAEPFEASIKLNDKIYGTAVAINKKTAKNKAALATLEMLIPGFKGQVESAQGSADMNCFNEVAVTDSRVHELCVHTGQLLPYQLLTECLKRHQGVADTNVSYDVQQGKRRSLNYTMMCGKHVVTGSAKNKKIGKQLAAQQILQLLHPEIKTWAELIKLYGTSLAQERARRKQEEQEIFDLKQRKGQIDDDDSDTQSSSKPAGAEEKASLEPNPELLAKLRDMMVKLQAAQDKRRKEEEASSSKKRKLTPMAAAVLAGKELLASSSTDQTVAFSE